MITVSAAATTAMANPRERSSGCTTKDSVSFAVLIG